ncbi:hypothetical protein [Streptomyces sp. NBC_00005]|uniref:hypothetical protein n=1 Tax=Streptomyces sp. NBC_00005 TaxID=2903609 RepID=UPI00324F7AD6
MELKPLARVAIAAIVTGTAIVAAVGPAVAAPSQASVVREIAPSPGDAGAVGGGTGKGLVDFGAATIDFVGRLIGTGGSGHT